MKNAQSVLALLSTYADPKRGQTNIRLHLDAFVGEERGKAHLVSVIGGDVEIGAIAAAFGNGDMFTVIDPTGAESIVTLGEKPQLFRGSITSAGRNAAPSRGVFPRVGGHDFGWQAPACEQ